MTIENTSPRNHRLSNKKSVLGVGYPPLSCCLRMHWRPPKPYRLLTLFLVTSRTQKQDPITEDITHVGIRT